MEPTAPTTDTGTARLTWQSTRVMCALCGGRGWYRVARLLTRQGDVIENAQLTCGECKGTGQTIVREL